MSKLLPHIEDWFREFTAELEFASLRYVREHSEYLSVRRNIVRPVSTGEDEGVMLTVREQGGVGYAATSDLTREGIRRARDRARAWAENSARCSVIDYGNVPLEEIRQGEYRTPVEIPWESMPLNEKIDLLRRECERLKTDERVVDWDASLWHSEVQSFFVTGQGTRIQQTVSQIVPVLSCTANHGNETACRSFGARGFCRQGGLEVLEQTGFASAAPKLAEEALELLAAPNCPTGRMDTLLAPDQLFIQIHESIGHPLELDRILGDERNYAGTSFVSPEMFGQYQYGSDLLNITFDPDLPGEFASYAFDDDGLPARREYLIKNGILLRGLGGMTSQARSGLPGVANSRATSWNRPPIDRMANLNLEPGTASFEDMVSGIEKGILLQTNCSWSIDDSRNKFQFGCERGQIIREGELKEVVKKPNYRGVSATFWRNLKCVGSRQTFEVLGSPFCGKGEPNQVIRVGHAAPACVFADVDVFGGE